MLRLKGDLPHFRMRKCVFTSVEIIDDTEMPYSHSLVLLQSYYCAVKYSEKQIGFSHGNLHNLHLLSNSWPAKTWPSTRNKIFSSTSIDTTSIVLVLLNRMSLDFDHLKSRQTRLYIQNSQMKLASAAGNPDWLRKRPT